MSYLKRPIQIEEFQLAIRDLSDSDLSNIREQINRSISKLNTSNQLMYDLLKDLKQKEKSRSEEDVYEESSSKEIQDDIKLYSESIHENEVVLRNQFERLESLRNEFTTRGLSQSDEITADLNSSIAAKKSELISQDNDFAKDGVYL